MNTFRVGFVTSTIREDVEALEALPIDSLWVGGHVAAPGPVPEAMVQLARLSALTRRVRIGTSILLLPLYPPAVVAKQIADIDRETSGRVTLGIGVGGEYEAEFRACGVPMTERGRRADEAIPLLRKLWTAEEITHAGPHYPMARVRIHPAPAQAKGPAIIVAGRKEPAMVRAAKFGDGWMPYLYSPRAYAESVQRIRTVAGEMGRDLTGFEFMVFLFTTVRDNREEALKEAAAVVGGTYNQDFTALADRLTAAGTPEQVAVRIQQYLDAGARHIIFAPTARDDRLAMAKRILSDVVPRLVGRG